VTIYRYEGTQADGEQVSGFVEAFDEIEAFNKAKDICRVVHDIAPTRTHMSILQKDIGSGKIKTKALAIMCAQFTTILSAGMNLADCVSLVAGQTSDNALKGILEEVTRQVAAGKGLAASFEGAGAEKLPVLFYETVRAAEQAGDLAHSFATMQRYFDNRDKTRSQLTRTLVYPVFVLIIAIVVVAIIMVVVLPTFENLLSSYNANMPVATQVLIGIADFLAANIGWIVLTLVVLVIALRIVLSTSRGSMAWNQLKLKLPGIGKVNRLNGATQFAATMEMLLSAGVPMTQAVLVTSRVMSNHALGARVKGMVAGLEEGRRLGACMRTIDAFPQPLIEMCAIGEETGELTQTLATMAAFYDREVDGTVRKAIALLEPIVLVMMALIAGYIVIALYLAMFAIYGSM
jgi:type IV pilus assembly protein PilC